MNPNPPQSTARYWIGVVSKNHVERGVAGGFAQTVTASVRRWRA